MKIENWDVDAVRPHKRNPRINEAAVAPVAAAIEKFGFRQPIVVDVKGVIIIGHVRWQAAQKWGLKKVPVHMAREAA